MKSQRPLSGLIKKKIQQEKLDLNPLTNGTIQGDGSHLMALSVRSADLRQSLHPQFNLYQQDASLRQTKRKFFKSRCSGNGIQQPFQQMIKSPQNVKLQNPSIQNQKKQSRPQTSHPSSIKIPQKDAIIEQMNHYLKLNQEIKQKSLDTQNDLPLKKQEITQETCCTENNDVSELDKQEEFSNASLQIYQKLIKEDHLTSLQSQQRIEEIFKEFPDYFLHQSGIDLIQANAFVSPVPVCLIVSVIIKNYLQKSFQITLRFTAIILQTNLLIKEIKILIIQPQYFKINYDMTLQTDPVQQKPKIKVQLKRNISQKNQKLKQRRLKKTLIFLKVLNNQPVTSFSSLQFQPIPILFMII